MFFQKNLPVWERVLRVCIGLIVVAIAFIMPIATVIQWVAMAASVMFACTGFIGICPMCAMFGRRLKHHES